MLGGKRVAATIPVRDPAQVRSFYEGTLGLKVSRELADGSIEYECGGGTSVYTVPGDSKTARMLPSGALNHPPFEPAISAIPPSVFNPGRSYSSKVM